jgi:hypothetical protein
MRPYTELADAVKELVASGTLKPGKSISLKKVALAAGLDPGYCAGNLKGNQLQQLMEDFLRMAGLDYIYLMQVGSGRYRRLVFKFLP